MPNSIWTAANIPDQTGKIILITGASSGLGLEATTVLAGKGANLVLGVRNLDKGALAVQRIKAKHPAALLNLMHLDLADLESIRIFAEQFHAQYDALHVLINNAGVMFPHQREVTKQGFEIQFGTNHLGPFALTGRLLDLLKATPSSRVVTQSSNMHKLRADIHFEDLNWQRSYSRTQAYAQSKLANLLFTHELDRRFKLHRIRCIAAAAHPGLTATNLWNTSGFLMSLASQLVAQKVEIGALSILRAATQEGLVGCEYFGPSGRWQLRGHPEQVICSDKAYDVPLAERLWGVSEMFTGIRYAL